MIEFLKQRNKALVAALLALISGLYLAIDPASPGGASLVQDEIVRLLISVAAAAVLVERIPNATGKTPDVVLGEVLAVSHGPIPFVEVEDFEDYDDLERQAEIDHEDTSTDDYEDEPDAVK